MQFTIPVDTIKAILCATPKKDIRYYLNGICLDVRATDAVAVGTDGHMLIAVAIERTEGDDSSTIPGQYIIPRDALEGLKAPYKGGPALVTIEPAGGFTITTGGATISGQLIDGKFPDWRKVVPRSTSCNVAQFDHELVAAFGKAHGLLGGKHSPAIFHNGNGAARVQLAGDSIGVLMPMRSDGITLENPAWIDSNQASVAAAA